MLSAPAAEALLKWQRRRATWYRSPVILSVVALYICMVVTGIVLGYRFAPKALSVSESDSLASPLPIGNSSAFALPSPSNGDLTSSLALPTPQANDSSLSDPSNFATNAGDDVKECYLTPIGGSADDGPSILQAFKDCAENSKITFSNNTFNIGIVMDTRGLKNVEIDLQGTLLWSKDIPYWLANSLPMGYQMQSTAWLLGGDNITFHGHNYGTFDGNGQVWYDFIRGASNFPRRPHALTISNTTNSLFTGLRFVQSQMWTMTVIHSENVLLEDIYVNSTSHSRHGTINTDGADTIYANNITFNRWEVINGDDAISPKANSTNILVENSVFHSGSGVAVGSIGQFDGWFETIENVTVRKCEFRGTLHAVYFKTWTGQHVGRPPNGGGGGLGFINNVTMHDLTLYTVRNTPLSITQCTVFAGAAGDCNTSLFRISNISMTSVKGTINHNPLVSFQCSRAAPCRDFEIDDIEVTLKNGTLAGGYRCSHLEGGGGKGFKCTGRTCEKPSGDGTCYGGYGVGGNGGSGA